MAIKAVIFDFDGTVANTNQVVIDSWKYTYKKVRGVDVTEDFIMKSFGEPLEITMKRDFADLDTDWVIDVYREYQKNFFKEKITLFPGMKELMKGLKDGGYKIGIVTSRTRSTTLTGMESLGIGHLVDNLVSCDDTQRHKPNPEPVLKALEYFGINPREALMVGDSIFDIRCARGAGVKMVLVGWAVAVEEETLRIEDRPDWVIGKADELFTVISEG